MESAEMRQILSRIIKFAQAKTPGRMKQHLTALCITLHGAGIGHPRLEDFIMHDEVFSDEEVSVIHSEMCRALLLNAGGAETRSLTFLKGTSNLSEEGKGELRMSTRLLLDGNESFADSLVSFLIAVQFFFGAPRIARCIVPGCDKLFVRTYRNKMTCGDTCRQSLARSKHTPQRKRKIAGRRAELRLQKILPDEIKTE